MYIIYIYCFFPITSVCVFAATFPWKYINSQHRHVLSTWPARPVGQPGPFSLMIHVHQVGRLVLRKTHGFWPSNMGGNPCTTWKIYKEPYVCFCHTSNVEFLWRSKSINICWYPHQFIADDTIAGCFHPPQNTVYQLSLNDTPCVSSVLLQ